MTDDATKKRLAEVKAARGGMTSRKYEAMRLAEENERDEMTQAIHAALNQLMVACGFDKSESATEPFVHMLTEATQQVDWSIMEDDNDDGLMCDVNILLAESIKYVLLHPTMDGD
jgi:hypothetical protein